MAELRASDEARLVLSHAAWAAHGRGAASGGSHLRRRKDLMADRNRNTQTGGRNRDMENQDMMNDRDNARGTTADRGQTGTRSPGARGSQGQHSAGGNRGS